MKRLNELLKMGWDGKDNEVVVELVEELLEKEVGTCCFRSNTLVFLGYKESIAFPLYPAKQIPDPFGFAREFPISSAILIKDGKMKQIYDMKKVRKEVEESLKVIPLADIENLLCTIIDEKDLTDSSYTNMIRYVLGKISTEKNIRKDVIPVLSHLLSPLGPRDRTYLWTNGKKFAFQVEDEIGVAVYDTVKNGLFTGFVKPWENWEHCFHTPKDMFSMSGRVYNWLEDNPSNLHNLYEAASRYAEKELEGDAFLYGLGERLLPKLELNLDTNTWYNAMKLACPEGSDWVAALNKAITLLDNDEFGILIEGLKKVSIK